MDNIIIPLCDCHGVQKIWNKHKKCKAGGYWRCRIAKRENQKKYSKTEKGKKVNAKAKKKWSQTEKGKKSIREKDRRYLQTEKGKIVNRAATARYRNTAHGYMRDYLSSRERQLKSARAKAVEELEDIRKQLKELGLEPR